MGARLVPQRTVGVVLGSGMLALAFYAASPYVTLWRVGNALRSHDVAELRTTIDWTRVRAGLKAELTDDQAAVATVKQASAHDDDLPDFGESFAKTAVSNVVDQDCDAEHVDAMFGSSPSSTSGTFAMARRMIWAFFTGPETFQALLRVSDDPRAEPVRVRMVFSGHHGWRVTNVWLPQTMLNSPDAKAT